MESRRRDEGFARDFAESARIDIDIGQAHEPHYYRGMLAGLGVGSLAVRATRPVRLVAGVLMALLLVSAGWGASAHARERVRDVPFDVAAVRLRLAVGEEQVKEPAGVVVRGIEEALAILRFQRDRFGSVEAKHALDRLRDAIHR